MNKNKILILMIGTILIGIGLPTTFSLSTGQHQFNQIDPDNMDKFCAKCHGTDSISVELEASGNGIYNGGMRIHNTLKCISCHALTQGYGNGNKVEHAARIPSCIECHDDVSYGVLGNVSSELESATEAHKDFSTDDSLACIGCHTGVSITGSISYTYSDGIVRNGLTIG